MPDLNLKYKGFSLLFEYADSFASGLNGIYTDPNGFNVLQPEEISEYLILGDSQGIHFGYFTKNGYSLDVIYEQLNPEFVSGLNPIFRESNNFGIGLSKYLSDNNIKLQASLFKTEIKNNLNVNDDEYMSGSFIVTLVF